jgi:hypothetical protein
MLPVSLDCKTKRKPKEQSTMDNPETLATLATQDEEKTEGQSTMDNPETLRLVWPLLPVSLDCLLLIAPSVFSSSCVANAASISGFSIVDCPFGFLFVLCGQCTGNIGHTRRREY